MWLRRRICQLFATSRIRRSTRRPRSRRLDGKVTKEGGLPMSSRGVCYGRLVPRSIAVIASSSGSVEGDLSSELQKSVGSIATGSLPYGGMLAAAGTRSTAYVDRLEAMPHPLGDVATARACPVSESLESVDRDVACAALGRRARSAGHGQPTSKQLDADPTDLNLYERVMPRRRRPAGRTRSNCAGQSRPPNRDTSLRHRRVPRLDVLRPAALHSWRAESQAGPPNAAEP